MKEAEHHVSLQDVEVPGDDRFPFQNLHNYLGREQNEHVVKIQVLKQQSGYFPLLCKHAFLYNPSVKLLLSVPKED